MKMKSIMMDSKKGQSAGLVLGLVFGIVSLIIAVIIAFTMVSTLSNANLLSGGRVLTTATNESGFVNSSGYTLSAFNTYRHASLAITAVRNDSGIVITSGNYSVDSNAIVTNLSGAWVGTFFDYTFRNRTTEEMSTEGLRSNFSNGVGNVSDKIPTVLLVAIIVAVIGILALLVGVWQRMKMGGSGGI